MNSVARSRALRGFGRPMAARSLVMLGVSLLLPTLFGVSLGCEKELPQASGQTGGDMGPRSRQHGKAWDIAKQVAQGVGQPVRASKFQGEPWVAVFQETHVSRVGQVEIALMLYRLYRDYGMRHIALEGYVRNASADASWFHKLPATPGERKRVATQLLQEGEISAAEYLALLLPELSLHPIEDPLQYAVELGEGGGGAGMTYLLRIALKLLENPRLASKHAAEITRLQNQEKPDEFLEYLLEIDPWVAEKAAVFRQEGKVVQAGEWLDLLTEIEKKVQDVGARPEPGERQAMRELKRFFGTADERSLTMAEATSALARLSSGPPIAMMIGAAHTDRVCREFDQSKMPYVVLGPRSLAGEDKIGDIDMDAFFRKGRKLSVDNETLGRLIDGRKKPPPVIAEAWLQAKASLYLLTHKIAKLADRAERSGAAPPRQPPFGLSSKELNLPAVRVNLRTIRLVDGEVVFKAILFPTDTKRARTLWVRAKTVARPAADADIEPLLKMAMTKLRTGREKSARIRADADAKDDRKTTTPVVHVSSEVIAKFSSTEAGIRRGISS